MLSFEERRYLVERIVERVVLDGSEASVQVIVPVARGAQQQDANKAVGVPL